MSPTDTTSSSSSSSSITYYLVIPVVLLLVVLVVPSTITIPSSGSMHMFMSHEGRCCINNSS